MFAGILTRHTFSDAIEKCIKMNFVFSVNRPDTPANTADSRCKFILLRGRAVDEAMSEERRVSNPDWLLVGHVKSI